MYDSALQDFFIPYHSMVDLMCRVAVNQQILTEPIITFSKSYSLCLYPNWNVRDKIVNKSFTNYSREVSALVSPVLRLNGAASSAGQCELIDRRTMSVI